MDSDNGRRDFLKKLAFSGAAVGTAGTAAAGTASTGTAADKAASPIQVPRRKLGKTNTEISMLALGLGSVFTKPRSEDPEDTEVILQRALDHGINYWDTANNYGPSQKMLGPMIERNRDKIFLVSKSAERGYDGFKKELEISLTTMRTDHLDLFHIHSMNPDKDTDFGAIEKGALRAALEAKEQGIIKNVGITGHSGAAVLKQAVEAWDLDAIMTVLPVDRPDNGAYEDVLLPVVRKKNMGLLAMKTNRHARNSDLPGAQLVRYALSLKGVSAAVVGLDSIVHLMDNIAMCTNFTPFNKDEMALMTRMAKEGLAFAGSPPWENPEYWDGAIV